MRTIFFAALCTFFVPPSGDAEAKRKPPPEFSMCNKTKEVRKVAVLNYSGRGRYTTSGWTEIKPTACVKMRTDSVHIDKGKLPSGVNPKRSRSGCIKNGKFRITGDRSNIRSGSYCAGKGARLGTFYAPRRGVTKIDLE